jgi:hypothetical protein
VFGREFRDFVTIFVRRNGIPSCFLFRKRVQNRIPRFFLFRGTAGIPSEITICSVYFVFRGIIFLSEIPNPTHTQGLLPFTWPPSYHLSCCLTITWSYRGVSFVHESKLLTILSSPLFISAFAFF